MVYNCNSTYLSTLRVPIMSPQNGVSFATNQDDLTAIEGLKQLGYQQELKRVSCGQH